MLHRPFLPAAVPSDQLLKWLLARLRPREVDSNKQYASEILAILVQQSGGWSPCCEPCRS